MDKEQPPATCDPDLLGRFRPNIPVSPIGHRSLGYWRAGTYRCECGEAFTSPATGPFPAGAVGFQAIQDAWRTHQAIIRNDKTR